MCQARGSWAAHCFCISPGPNGPRSPPFLNELQSLRISAYLTNASSVLPSAAILSMYVWSSAMAASPLTFAVDSPVRRETGLREPLNLMRRWRASYFADISVLERFGSPADGALPYRVSGCRVRYRERGSHVAHRRPQRARSHLRRSTMSPASPRFNFTHSGHMHRQDAGSNGPLTIRDT